MKTKMTTLFCLFGGILYANISGIVFRDLPVNGSKTNVYGVKDANELGVKDVVVSAYDKSGKKIDSTTTKVDGSFELKTTSGKYRVEFNKWPSFLKESFSGNVNNSSVRFVDDDSSVNFALHNPADFSESNPKVIIPITYNGDPTKGGTTGGAQAIKLFSYDGSNQMSNVALNKDVGAIWGMAYGKKSKTLYAALVLKRHIGFGPMGIDGIYKVDLNNTSAPVVTQWLSLNSLDGVDVGSNPRSESLPANLGESNNDPEAFVEAGKIGIGDIDLSDDEKKLYVVNLNNHGELLTIDTATKKLQSLAICVLSLMM